MTTSGTASGPSPPPDASALRAQLRDGAVIGVRPIRMDDGERLRRFHARLSPASIRLRYLHVVPSLSEEMGASLTHADGINLMALVATVAADGAVAAPEPEIIGIVDCTRMSADAAEVAFLVEDAWQGRGVAGVLLREVATCARACGFRRLLAITTQSNVRMLAALRRCGLPCALQERGDEQVDVWLDISQDPARPGVYARETMPGMPAENDPDSIPTYP